MLMYCVLWPKEFKIDQSTVVCFTGFFSGGFISAIVVNLPEIKLAKRTSVQSTTRDFTVIKRNYVPTYGEAVFVKKKSSFFRNIPSL